AAGRWRLNREAEILRNLEHPCLVPVIDAGFAEDSFYAVLPFRDAPTLRGCLRRGPLPLDQVLPLALDILRGLEAAHGHGILHRNLSSANVMVGTPSLITDFSPLGVWEVPAEGVLPTHLAPEQAGLLHGEIDARTDLYAVGALLYEALTGRPPFLGANLTELLQAQLTQDLKPLRAHVAAVPRAFDEIVARLLARDPRARYQSATGVLWDLEALSSLREVGSLDPDLQIGMFDRRHTLAEPAFVGRRAEMVGLGLRLDRLGEGRGGVVSIEGPSGMGKSRLLQETSLLALSRGFLAVRHATRPQSTAHPFEVFIGVVRELRQRLSPGELRARLATLEPHQRDMLRTLLPPLRDMEAETAPAPTASEVYVADLLAGLLLALGTPERPAVIFLDDAQWTDALTRRALSRFHQVGRQGHVLVVAAARNDEGSGLRVDRLTLSAFSSEEVRHLVESMAGPVPQAAHELLALVAEGNPFMAAEALRALVASGGLRHDEEGWHVVEERCVELQTTPRAAAALGRRLERISQEAREVLTVAAVLGRECDLELLAAVTTLPPEALMAAGEQAREAHLVWRSADGARLTFVHDRLRDALASQVPKAEATTLHRAAASWLQRKHPDLVFDLAFHLQEAHAPEEALPWALAAAAEARKRHALDVAARYFGMAASAIETADEATWQSMAFDYADVLTRLARFSEADHWLQVCQTLTEGALPSARIEALRSQLALERRDLAGAAACASSGLTLLKSRSHSQTAGHVAVKLYSALAESCRRRGLFDAALEACRRGGEQSLPEGLSSALAPLWAQHALVLALSGDLGPALDLCRRALEAASTAGVPVEEARVQAALAPIYLLAGQVANALHFAEAAHAMLVQRGDPRETNLACVMLADCLMAAGRLREATALARQVFREALEHQDPLAQALAMAVWSRSTGGALPLDVVAPWLEGEGIKSDDVEARAAVTEALAICWLRRGEPEAAIDLLEAGGHDKPVALRARLRCWLATSCRRAAEALPMLAVLRREAWLRRSSKAAGSALALAQHLPARRAQALREAALMAAGRGNVGDAERLFSDALAASGEMVYEGAITRLARYHVGQVLGWTDADRDGSTAHRQLGRMQATVIAEMGVDLGSGRPTTVSLVDRFSNVIDCGRRLVVSPTRPAVLQTLQQAAQTLLRGEHFFLWDAAAAVFVNSDAPPLAQLLRDRVVEHRHSVSVDVEKDSGVPELLLLELERCGLGAPVLVKGTLRYVFILTNQHSEQLFGTDELRLAEYLGTVAGAVLENLENIEARFESETRFRALYDQADVGIVVMGTDSCLLEGNPFLSRITGYAAEELRGMPLEALIAPLYREATMVRLRPVLAGQYEHCRVELACRRKTGELLWTELGAALVRGQDGRPRFVVGALSDVSHQRIEKVVGFQETERQVLSSELHDTIAQPLVGLYYGLQTLESSLSDGSLSRLQGLEDQAERLLAELRTLISNMSVRDAASFEAVESMRQYVYEFRADSGLAVRLFTTGAPTLGGVTALFLYRIVQEALRNVARHAKATSVVVRIAVGPQRVRGVVADDGCGYSPPENLGKHFGTRGMRERAELLGGWCRIRSRRVGGTSVVFELPLPPSR
ncbi:MAG TPA: PAS domain S-box protein, partial [Candidatus Xenobia bacterium]